MEKSIREEIWKPVPGYEGLYDVSNLGRVRSYHNFGFGCRKQPRIVSQYRAKNGYMQISLCKDTIHKTTNVHRIVASAFLPSQGKKTQIDHINGIKSDNRVSNLEWVTARENTIRSVATGLKPLGERHGMSKLREYDIIDIRALYAEGGYSQRKLGRMFGVSHSVIGKIVRQQAWKHIPSASKGGA